MYLKYDFYLNIVDKSLVTVTIAKPKHPVESLLYEKYHLLHLNNSNNIILNLF